MPQSTLIEDDDDEDFKRQHRRQTAVLQQSFGQDYNSEYNVRIIPRY